MLITNYPPHVFADRAAAQAVCDQFEKTEYRIDMDPKGTGKCLVRLLDDGSGYDQSETGRTAYPDIPTACRAIKALGFADCTVGTDVNSLSVEKALGAAL